MTEHPRIDDHSVELRLFLEELCCNLCRFLHIHGGKWGEETVRIDQEVSMGVPGGFADIRIWPPGEAPYFVEVKFGYSPRRIVRSLARKYGPEVPKARAASKVVLVVDASEHPDWNSIEAEIRRVLRPGLKLEVWDERALLALLREKMNLELSSVSTGDLLQLREAVTRAKVSYAFGPESKGDALEASLVWHFGYWRLRKLIQEQRCKKLDFLRPGLYRDVVVLNADLTSFSSYVRDTRDEQVVRDCLTSFYSKTRYQVINAGGMLYQFIGDAVIGLFGVPVGEPDSAHLKRAIDCAMSLVDIGDSVSAEWQRQIDRVQSGSGVHIGMAIGDLQIMPLLPFSRTYMGAVGDPINMTARLQRDTRTSEVLITNTLYHQLDPETEGNFDEVGVVEAKNVGTLRAWRMNLEKVRQAAAR
jgi:adenylate cyclase